MRPSGHVSAKARVSASGRRRDPSSPVSRRPVPFDAAEALLKATSDLMREKNGAEPSVAEIAERAQVAPALIRYYYGTKDSLLLELLKRDMAPGHEQLNFLLTADMSATEKLRQHISGMINLYYRVPYLNQLMLILAQREKNDEFADEATRLMKPLSEFHRVILSQGFKSGELRYIDPMLFYFSLLGIVDRIFSAKYSLGVLFGRDEVDADLKRRFTEHSIDLLLGGILASPIL